MPSISDAALIVAALFTVTSAVALTVLAVLAPDREARRRAQRILELLFTRRRR